MEPQRERRLAATQPEGGQAGLGSQINESKSWTLLTLEVGMDHHT